MTTPKVNTIKRGDTRFYVSPDSGKKAPGVTSILNMIPKPFLTFWAAKMVADEFVADPGTAVSLAIRNPSAAVDHLKAAPRRYTAQAATLGSNAHDLFERMAKGEKIGRVDPAMRWAVDGFQAFVDEFDPEFLYLEETVWSETHDYAGSFDVLMRITVDGERLLVRRTRVTQRHTQPALDQQMDEGDGAGQFRRERDDRDIRRSRHDRLEHVVAAE